jgi:hypothetical protein
VPIKLERELLKEALKKHLTGKKKDAYVFGTLRQTGWVPKRERK